MRFKIVIFESPGCRGGRRGGRQPGAGQTASGEAAVDFPGKKGRAQSVSKKGFS